MVILAKEVFDQNMVGPNQLYVQKDDVVKAADLLSISGIIMNLYVKTKVLRVPSTKMESEITLTFPSNTWNHG